MTLTEKVYLAYAVAMITPAFCRAARAWFGWTQADLAQRAMIGISTVRDFETGTRVPIQNNQQAIQRAFEQAGASFVISGDKITGLDFTEVLERAGIAATDLPSRSAQVPS
jgi:transcriptional regulator with XRE-family HTH domain